MLPKQEKAHWWLSQQAFPHFAVQLHSSGQMVVNNPTHSHRFSAKKVLWLKLCCTYRYCLWIFRVRPMQGAPFLFWERKSRNRASDCQKIAFLPYCVCRGDHWSPANLPQQRIFWDSFLARQTGTGEQCSPLQEFFDSLRAYAFVRIRHSYGRRASFLSG